MIPLKIELKNFLSYGSELQTISLGNYPLICLSGKNGHGKSALLDAITWALWGQARKTFGVAKADDGLLRLGQTHMMVILEFMFNNQMYKIRREFTKSSGGKAQAGLEFGLIDGQTNGIIPLTDKTIRQTQEKIEKLLNLDFDSFVNSAFLRQGQANEFSKKNAKERKTILATILGLNRYDSLKNLALEKVKDATIKKNNLISLQEKQEQEIKIKPSIMLALEHVTAECITITTHEAELNARKAALDKQKKMHLDYKHQQQLIALQIQQADDEYGRALSALRATRLTWSTIHKKLLASNNHLDLEKEKNETLQKLHGYQAALGKTLSLKEQILTTREHIARMHKDILEKHTITVQVQKITIERLLIEQQEAQKKLAEREKNDKVLALDIKIIEKKIDDSNISLESSQKKIAPLAHYEKEYERRKEYYQKFANQGTWSVQELAELEKKIELVSGDNDKPSCPLCQQGLSSSHKKELEAQCVQRASFVTWRIARLRTLTSNLKESIQTQHNQIMILKKEHNDTAIKSAQQQGLGDQRNTLEKQARENKELLGKLQESMKDYEQRARDAACMLKNLLAQEDQLIATNTAYQEQQKNLQQLQELYLHETKSYNQQEHSKAEQQVQRIEKKLAEYKDLFDQQVVQEERKKNIALTITRLKELQKLKVDFVASLTTIAQPPQQTADLAQQTQELDAQSAQLKTSKENLLQQQGGLERQLATIVALEAESLQQKKIMSELNDTVSDYQLIATAASKDGIQALLIDEAIPDIEHEANKLLAKLSNNQSQIFIESLRDLKKGGTKETLDIKISDTIGIRPYEMFSGGEAFRIDFALRIAISRLLARRAGTSLQTLIIDEGFGSQDEEGLANIMDVLHKIKDDFEKIIIVSHLPFMKDNFPVHFFIEKNSEGSTVQVLHHD